METLRFQRVYRVGVDFRQDWLWEDTLGRTKLGMISFDAGGLDWFPRDPCRYIDRSFCFPPSGTDYAKPERFRADLSRAADPDASPASE